MKRYSKTERTLLVCCFFLYTAAYISRCNLAPSLAAIADSFGANAARAGLLPTCFAVSYGTGQIFSGLLADRLPAPRLMLMGLMGSALINVLFSFCPWFLALVLLWLVNGIFQSLIWTPIVRMLAVHFRDSVRDHAAFFMSLAVIFGYLAAWSLAGLLTSLFSWRTAFLTSGLVTIIVTVPSMVCMKRLPLDYTARPAKQESSARAPVSRLLLHTNLPLLLVACFANGYVRDSVTNWAAKLLMDTYGIDLSSAVGILLIIPAVSFLGIRLGQAAYRRNGGDPYFSTGLMYLVCAVLCVLLPFSMKHLVLCVVLLVAASAMAYGLNPLLTTIMPLQFSKLNRVALAAGLMDAMIYLGSSFSGSFAGFLSDQHGWSAVFVSWAAAGFAGVLMMALARRAVNNSTERRKET